MRSLPGRRLAILPLVGREDPMQVSVEQESNDLGSSRSRRTLGRAYEFADLSDYPWKERLLIRAADLAFFVLIRLIGATTRWQVQGWEHWDSVATTGKKPIYVFWHNRVFLATHFWQRRGIVVMTSQSFDGEYIARFIKRFGYGAARGSSTRGGTGAIVEMVRLMRAGRPTAFAINGPKGPRYVAKMGAVLLAKKTGNPVLPFSLTPAKRIEIGSWDRLQVPLPFTKVLVEFAKPIYVAKDADEQLLKTKRAELQQALDE